MPITLGAKPQADFTQPLELLQDCHRRVEQFLQVHLTVAREIHGRALDAPHRQALETALRYFLSAATRHTEDEEQSLFPRLRAAAQPPLPSEGEGRGEGSSSPDPAAIAALAQVDALEADHVAANVHHARINALSQLWLDRGTLTDAEADELVQRLAALNDLYRAHIAVEDTQVFPLAARMLDAAELAQIGQEMAARRAQDPGRPDSRCGQRRREQFKDA
jgi:hemerythrin-like domain-containing protein